MPKSDYSSDFYAWATEQAALLRAGKFAAADIEHIAEELESLGKTEKRELVNCVGALQLGLLKWRYQPRATQRQLAGVDQGQTPERARASQGQSEPQGETARSDGEPPFAGRSRKPQRRPEWPSPTSPRIARGRSTR